MSADIFRTLFHEKGRKGKRHPHSGPNTLGYCCAMPVLPKGRTFYIFRSAQIRLPPSGELARQRLRGYNKKGARTFRYEHLIVQE